MYKSSRRNFLKLAAGGVMARFGQWNALAAGNANYKALVCIFLNGGNDGSNTIVPIATATQNFANYAGSRGPLALPQASLLPIGGPGGDQYGLHPKLKELQTLYLQSKVAVLSNVGVLVKPVTRAEYLAKSKPVPQNLFSHSDQTDQWQTGRSDNFATTGWAGRAADLLAPLNAQSTYPMVVSPSGCGIFCSGSQTYATLGGTSSIANLGGVGAPRYNAFQTLLAFDNGMQLVQSANKVVRQGIGDDSLLAGALASAPALGTSFPAGNNLANQLLQVAKIISVRGQLGLNRQIFFCSLGGFDTHTALLATQDALLAQLSPAMDAFYKATLELGVDQQVTSFTCSEFGRTVQPSSGGGSDHAWGGHHFIMGGAVKGGAMYGQFPSLALGGPDDANTRGTLIPTTSVDQYGATLASWFGVAGVDMPTLFSDVLNFGSNTNLGFLG